MRVAIVHDGTITPGGAVQVVTAMASALDADLYVGFSGKDPDWWHQHVPNEVTLLRRPSSGGTLNDILTARKLLKLDIRAYDVVITSGPAAKFFQPYDDQIHVHYLHHPPLSSLWFTGGLFAYLVTTLDRVETHSLPYLIANSDLTATRAHRQYGREVDETIPPPVEVGAFSTDRDRVDGQLVMVGRLEERKRPALAIQAMERLPGYTLTVVGDGPLRSSLASQAPDNVEFRGYLDGESLRRTVEESVAGLFLAEREDFGITPIEYMAAGTPVVGVDEPNTNNQVDAETGVLVEPDADAVVDGVETIAEREWDRSALRARADEYGTDRFHDRIQSFVEEIYF